MTGTMKRAISVILVLVMTVVGLSYTPKVARAEELTFTKLELSGYGSIWYAVKGTNGFIGWVNPWYGDAGTTLQFIYSAVNTNVKVTINGEEKNVENSGGLVKEIANGSLKVNPQKLSASGTTEVVLSADGGKGVTVVVTKSDPAYGIPEEPTSGGGTSTLKALKDAYVYNFVESGEGFKVGFSDPNEVTATDGATYTYTLNIAGRRIENIKESGAVVDLGGLNLEEGKEYTVTMNAVYKDGSSTETSPSSTATKFTYTTTATNAYANGIAKIFFTTSSSSDDALNVNGLYDGNQENKPKVPVAITVQKADGTIEAANYGTANVRGNSTANAAKKPYNFKFNKKTDLFQMGKAKKWSLLSNLFDKTLIRNQIGMDFQRSLEEEQSNFPDGTSKVFTSECRPVDLYIDGDYAGTYTLIESVETGSSRVDIDIDYVQEDTDEIVEGAEPDTIAINGTKYETYDALIELANDANENRYDSEAYYFRTGLEIFSINEPERTNSNYDYAPNATNKPEFVKKTQTFVQGFETALQSGNYDTFCQYIDVDSFVDFYITSELFMTKDINFSSTRFYIRDGKLYAGPLWDLDLSSGNIVDHASFEDFYAQNFLWFKLLMQNDTFKTKVKARYAQLQGRIENLYAQGGTVDTAYHTIKASAKHNYEDAYNKKIGLTDGNGGYNIGWKYTYIYGNNGFFDQAIRNLTAIQAMNGYGVYGSVTVYNNYDSYVDDYRKWLENRNEWLIENWNIDLTEQPSEPTTPEVTTPEPTTPEPTTPEVTTPEPTAPETTTPEVTTPEPTTPEPTTPEPTTPEEVTTPEPTTPEPTTPTEQVTLESDDVDVQGFQMNTDNSVGGVAEFNPSYRVVSRVRKEIRIDGILYKVKSYGTIYGVDTMVPDKRADMILNSDNVYVKSFPAEIGTYTNYVSGNGDEEYNNYYALSFKETSYSYDSINTKYTFRAYAILDDGTQNGMVVYGRNIYSTSIYEIAKDLYDNCKMAAKTGHDFLYNNVLNLAAIQQNRNFIADAMKAALGITDASGEKYNLVNEVYNDLYYYVYCIEGQNYTYSDRGTFKPHNRETETKLLEYLNQATDTSYGTLSEWIYHQTSNYRNSSGEICQGYYREVPYAWDNYVFSDYDSKAEQSAVLTSNEAAVKGFQIRSNGEADNVAFRTVCRAPAVGDTIAASNGETYTVKAVGTIYTLDINDTGYIVNDQLDESYTILDKNSVEGEQFIYKGANLYNGAMVTYGYVATEMGTVKEWDDDDREGLYYVRTMTGIDAKIQNTIHVRAFVVTEEGEIIYSTNTVSTSVAQIADNLYTNSKSKNNTAHQYLYNAILNNSAVLSVSNPYYRNMKILYGWNNNLYSPEATQ